MRAIIDACVIIDVLQNREPFAKEAANLLSLCALKAFEGLITATSMTNIYYVMHKYVHNSSLARQTIKRIAYIVNVADTTGLDCKIAIESPLKDYEDVVMAETAKRIKADYIVTRNTRDFEGSEVYAIPPEDFLKFIDDQRENPSR